MSWFSEHVSWVMWPASHFSARFSLLFTFLLHNHERKTEGKNRSPWIQKTTQALYSSMHLNRPAIASPSLHPCCSPDSTSYKCELVCFITWSHVLYKLHTLQTSNPLPLLPRCKSFEVSIPPLHPSFLSRSSGEVSFLRIPIQSYIFIRTRVLEVMLQNSLGH